MNFTKHFMIIIGFFSFCWNLNIVVSGLIKQKTSKDEIFEWPVSNFVFAARSSVRGGLISNSNYLVRSFVRY